MSDPRDDLAAIIGQWISDLPSQPDFLDAADAILAAGWAKPPNVIPSDDIDPTKIRNTCGQFIEWDDTTQRWVHA